MHPESSRHPTERRSLTSRPGTCYPPDVIRPPLSRRRWSACAAIVVAVLALTFTGVRSEPKRWAPVPGKSQVFFDASYPLGTFSGRTEQVQGDFRADPADLKLGVTGSLQINPLTIRTGEEGRDRDMWKMLQTNQYPEIRYTVDGLEASFASVTERPDVLLTINGRLSIRGVERPISFPGRIRRRDDGIWVRGETTIKMSDFSIPPPRRLFMRVKDSLLVSFDLLLVEQN